MEDMTYDMAGSATVGSHENSSFKKIKNQCCGVVGLVENMPGGNAKDQGIL